MQVLTYFYASLGIKEDVVRFDISMDDVLFVKMPETLASLKLSISSPVPHQEPEKA